MKSAQQEVDEIKAAGSDLAKMFEAVKASKALGCNTTRTQLFSSLLSALYPEPTKYGAHDAEKAAKKIPDLVWRLGRDLQGY